MCEDMDTHPPSKRLRISELNPHLLCALCGGYLIDATTIIECLHSFCKTCIVRYLETSKYCPICEVLIHKTRPWQNIRLDHALQNAVYKMVPGLFQSEMRRRREFCQKWNDGKHGGKGLQAQGVLGSRIIFSQDEEFSISIEFSPNGQPVPVPETGAKEKSGKRPTINCRHDKRYLKCPAALRVSHLKKFIRSKFSLPNHILVELFHSQEPLCDTFSLMDVAYIYLWKRDCVLRLFYSFYQKPAKQQPVETITKTVAEKVKEKHEVKGRERERAEREKEDQNKTATKKEKDRGKDVKQGKIYGRKDVPTSSHADASQSFPKGESYNEHQGSSKRKSNSSDSQTLSSPTPDKKQKKAFGMNKPSPNKKGGLMSPTEASLSTKMHPQYDDRCYSISPAHHKSDCQLPSHASSTIKVDTSSTAKARTSNGGSLVMESDTPCDNSVTVSSQKMKCPTSSFRREMCQASASMDEIMVTNNCNVSNRDSQLTPNSHDRVSSLPTLPSDMPNTCAEKEKGSQMCTSKSIPKPNSVPITNTLVPPNSQVCPSVCTIAPSNSSNTSTSSLASNCVTSSSALATITVSQSIGQSFGQNHSIAIQSMNLRNQNSGSETTVGNCKGSSVNTSNVKVSQQNSVIPTQSIQLKCQFVPTSGQTLSLGENSNAGLQTSSIGVGNTEMNHQASAMSVANNKSFHPTVSATSTNTVKLHGLNSSTANTTTKTTSCMAVSAPGKPAVNPAPASTLTKLSNSGNFNSSPVPSPKSGQSKRKSAHPMPTPMVKSTSSSPNGHQTPSPREDSTSVCEYDIDMTEEERLSPSQSNLFERMDLLAKMVDSDGKQKDSGSNVKMDTSMDKNYPYRDQSPSDICQSSAAEQKSSSGCDDVEVISVEFIDSPKKSSDQSRCDDSVQSLKSDDSGVATTMEIEDDCLDLPQKGQSPLPSPALHRISPATTDLRVSQPKLTTDSDKSENLPARSKAVATSTDEESPSSSCGHMTSSQATSCHSVEYSKPATVLINSSCQTTETGSMTMESSLMFAARVSPINEHRTMLRIPKDYRQSSHLSPLSVKDGTLSSPDTESKLTLCLPVSYLDKPATKQSLPANSEQSTRPSKNIESQRCDRLLSGSNGSSSTKMAATSSSSANLTSHVSSSVQCESVDLGVSSRDTSIASSLSDKPSFQTQTKTSTIVSSGSSYNKVPKEASIQDGTIPKLTVSNESVKMAASSKKTSPSESVTDKVGKSAAQGMGKNMVTSTKSTQPLKLTVTLNSGDSPKVSLSPKEPKKIDHLESKNSVHQSSSFNQTSKTSQSSKSHTVARIIATSSSPSPPPPVTSKLNNNVIQTTKISTLIPKSSSISSKSNSFSKQFSYPSNINNVPSSRSFLPSTLAHLSRADMVGLINGSASFSQNSMVKNSVLSSYPSLSSSSLSSNSSHLHHHHHHKSSSSKHKDVGEGRYDKPNKTKTIPPLSIPKSCLISPPLKLQRSPGSTDHYIFTHQNPYLPSTSTPNHNGERQRSKESKHNGNRTPTSPPTSTMGERQRVPSIKISDINRNPIIVESGRKINNSNNNNSSSSTNHHHRSHSHSGSRSESGSGRRRSGSSSHTPDAAGPSSSSSSSSSRSSAVSKEHRRPSDSEILLNSPWHMHSAAAEFLFHHPFKIPTANKFPNLHYDTDAMPLDYSQSSSKL